MNQFKMISYKLHYLVAAAINLLSKSALFLGSSQEMAVKNNAP